MIRLLLASIRRFFRLALVLIVLPIAAGASWYAYQDRPSSWRHADWSSTGTLPLVVQDEARVRIYAADTGRWKAIFAVHSWIAIKPVGTTRWTRFEVVGWGNPVRRDAYAADARWYSNPPEVIYELSGVAAAAAIPKIERAIADYKFRTRGSYRIWPGPNSNTFVADILRRIPELHAELPARALGKDFIGVGFNVAPTPSKSGWQFSYSGLIGGALAWEEGLEFHVLGATIGIDPLDLAIKLPSLGRLSVRQLFAS